jgi:steroid 5-alpha reductase family enzyme
MDVADLYFWPLIVAMVGFLAIWPVSVIRNDVSLVDLAWGPGFLVQMSVAAIVLPSLSAQAWLLLGVVGVWSLRLTWTLARRRLREGHEDARYTAIRDSWDPGFWWKSAFIVFLLQSVIQWLISIGPITGLAAASGMPGWLAYLGVLIAAVGLGLEALADQQLDQFKRTAGPGDLLQTGLRAHIRHPNYLGEIVFWVGVALITLDYGATVGLLSPVLIAVFLTRISGVPLLDERLSATRPGYGAYKAQVPPFLPALTKLNLR